MKPRSLLALALLLHFLAHPTVHVPLSSAATGASLNSPAEEDSPVSFRENLGTCLACRTAPAWLLAPGPLPLPALDAGSELFVASPLSQDSRLDTSLLSTRAPPLA